MKTAVVYWSGTGNTEAMAEAVANGANLLIASEIGSEGRNFQFAHHLVLFDLPLDASLVDFDDDESW